MIFYSTKYFKFITIKYGLTYFNDIYSVPDNIDIIREFQYSKKRIFSKTFYTIFINLTKDKDAIFAEFDKITKYQINKAKNRENIQISTIDEKNKKNEFYSFYNAFAKTKNLSPILESDVNRLINNDMIKIRTAIYNNEVLVYHSYILSNKRVRLMHSASLFRDSTDTTFRNLIGRANRLLHWDDICFFKENGYLIYDLGGYSIDKNNIETQAINNFKEGFGEIISKEYISQIPLTFKGYIFVFLKYFFGHI
jgi:lipid II:glycine glycyltransferase (peptidoglycan interpeptide bridge formation enzyme)